MGIGRTGKSRQVGASELISTPPAGQWDGSPASELPKPTKVKKPESGGTTTKRVKMVSPVKTTVQTEVTHGGFLEENAEAKIKTVTKKKPPLEKYVHSGTHGPAYKKK